MKNLPLIMVLAAVVVSAGCSTMKSRLEKLPIVGGEQSSAQMKEAAAQPVYGAPEKMLAIWKDSVRSQPGQKSMRGFGGRIFLYDRDGAPIRAQGDLVIYGFDDSVKQREGSKADQKIVLRDDKFQQRYSESGLGPSYSVWIDWDEVGGPDKNVTLIPFFRTPEGKIVRAGQSIYTLHSPTKEEQMYREKLVSHEEISSDGPDSSVGHANFLQSDGEGNGVVQASGIKPMPKKENAVRTTTIFVPKETQKRLRDSSFGINRRQRRSTESSADDSSESVAKESTRPQLPSRIEAARAKRIEEISNSHVFGKPGNF